MLSITGLFMLFDEEIETLRYGAIINIQEQSSKTDSSTQLLAVKDAFPSATITQFIPQRIKYTALC